MHLSISNKFFDEFGQYTDLILNFLLSNLCPSASQLIEKHRARKRYILAKTPYEIAWDIVITHVHAGDRVSKTWIWNWCRNNCFGDSNRRSGIRVKPKKRNPETGRIHIHQWRFTGLNSHWNKNRNLMIWNFFFR